MGKFAHCYDLPGGEQLLVTVFIDEERGPAIQYATEIHGEQVAAQIQLCDDADLLNLLKRNEVLQQAKIDITNLDEEDVLSIRRRFVAEHMKGVRP